MNKEIILKSIENDDELENYQKDFLSDMWKMIKAWDLLSYDLLLMPISEKTEIKIRKILYNMGDKMTQICDLMIKENNK